MIKAVLWDLDGTLIDSEAIHYRAIINEAQLIEKNIAWVQKLAKYDIVQAIVSNSDLQFVNKALEIMALEEHIQCICSRDKVSKGKPDPALYNYALRVLNIDSTDAITIEDSNSGISAAKRATILTLA